VTAQRAARPRTDRDEVFLELTKSICPVCKRVVDAEINVRDGRVVMRKRCPQHGSFEALVYSDADLYLSQLRFNKPGTLPLEFQTEVRDGCPLDCGLCPDHKQHTCVALIELNTACNLDCPVCFADSGHHPHGYSLTLEQAASMIDTLVRAEGAPEVLQLSGGEPTIHPNVLEVAALAKERGVQAVWINTNGIRLARDPAFAAEVARAGAHVYLQFDGFEEATHLALRGRDLRRDKERALEHCLEAGVTVSLVAAVERGVNEHELGDIVRFGVSHPAVNSVFFQPTTHAGRHRVFDPLERLTNADVMKLLAAQLPGWLSLPDFVPVPCCSPTCRSMCYALVDGDGFIPFARLVDVEDHLDYLSNRVIPELELRSALERMFSAAGGPGAERALLACEECGIDLPGAFGSLRDHVFCVVVQDFQDPYTLNVRQLMKCCVTEVTPDGRLIPFCAYNSVGYREAVRARMQGVPVAPVAPNARPLLPLLEPTLYGSRTAAEARMDGHGPLHASEVDGAAPAPPRVPLRGRADLRNNGRRLGD
jgi:hypothetical protein